MIKYAWVALLLAAISLTSCDGCGPVTFTEEENFLKQLNLQKLFSQFPEQLNELRVRGNSYTYVYVYTNDITHADDFEGPTTHKLYFAKDFGVIKWENADGEVWERQQ